MNSKKSSAHDAANHELSSEARAALDTFEAALKKIDGAVEELVRRKKAIAAQSSENPWKLPNLT